MKTINSVFRTLKITQKLSLIIGFSTIIGILMSLVLLVIYDDTVQKDLIKNELLVLSKITAQRSSAAVAFLDVKKARDNLDSLQLRENVGVACLFNSDGELFTFVARSVAALKDLGIIISSDMANACPQEMKPAGVYLDGDVLEVYSDVMQGSLQIGHLYVRAGLTELSARQWTFALVGAVGMIVGLIAALIVISPIKQQIASPIIELGKVARRVQHQKDYSVRAEFDNSNDDEISVTVDAFNNMLNTIEMNNIVLTKMAYYDALTGLGNRRLFMEKLEKSLERSREDAACMALMFIDLDKFKPVNDTLGHDVGDLLLETVSERLKMVMPPKGYAYRLGGDEFTVILEGDVSDRECEGVAQAILEKFAQTTVLKGNKVLLTASIGIAISNGNETTDQLLQRADAALYRVKDSGRNGYHLSSIIGLKSEKGKKGDGGAQAE